MRTDDDFEVKQAMGAVAKLGGYDIKRIATTDDLKDRTLTITLTRTSSGFHQERLPFEDVVDQVATVDGNGHVESVNSNPGGVVTKVTVLDSSDLTEKDETDPDEGVAADREAIAEEGQEIAKEAEQIGQEAEAGQVVDLHSKKRR
jgi:hypothetical protein